MVRRGSGGMLLGIAICVVGLLPVTAGARHPDSGDATPIARNLLVTASVKTALRAAHLALLQPTQRAGVRGPLKGTTYYGSVGSWRYALATFSHPGVGTTDQPELFSKAPGRGWRDRGDTGGCLSQGIIPRALLRVWKLRSNC